MSAQPRTQPFAAPARKPGYLGTLGEPWRSAVLFPAYFAMLWNGLLFTATGFGVHPWVDPLLAGLLANLTGLLLGVLVAAPTALVLALLRRRPFWRVGLEKGARAPGLVLGSALLLFIPLSISMQKLYAVVASLAIVALPLLLGLAVGLVRRYGLGRRLVACGATLAVMVSGVGFGWLLYPGSNRLSVDPLPTHRALSASTPTTRGTYAVKTLTYGSGVARHRPEYGARADLRTPTVNVSTSFKSLTGFKAFYHRLYWGFDATRFPLNGQVWYPDGPGPFPLVLMVHGAHNMERFSEPGYAYLGELLASRGYVAVSVDENFVNGSWVGDLWPDMRTRAYLLLKHLEVWRYWATTGGNPFSGKVDMEHIGLIGHSRGGEAVAMAAEMNRKASHPDDGSITFDFFFKIRALVALAPLDSQDRPYGRHVAPEGVSYLMIQGAQDNDMRSFQGFRQYDRLPVAPGSDRFKATLYVQGMNHGQMNTRWVHDYSPPIGWLFNTTPQLPGEEQRRIAATYVSAFLDDALKGNQAYRPLFRDPRAGAEWLPATRYAAQYADGSLMLVEGVASDSGFVKAEEKLLETRAGTYRGTTGLYLEWNGGAPVYSVAFPAGTAAGNVLTFDLATLGPEPVDFTVEVTTAGGKTTAVTLSSVATPVPTVDYPVTKNGLLDKAIGTGPVGPVMQTVEVPLPVDAAELSGIAFRFDRTPAGTVVLDQIGFRTDR